VAGMSRRANPPGGRYVNEPTLTTQSTPHGAFLKRKTDRGVHSARPTSGRFRSWALAL